MDNSAGDVGRPRRPSGYLQKHSLAEEETVSSSMSRTGEGGLDTLPASRFSGFKSGHGAGQRLQNPFSNGPSDIAPSYARSPTPTRGGITPPGYERRTNLSSGRTSGNGHAHSSKIPTGTGIPRARVSSVKDRVAMFESRPNDGASRTESPAPPASRTLQRSKTPTSSSPTTSLPKASAVSKVQQAQFLPVGRQTASNKRSPKKLTKESRMPPMADTKASLKSSPATSVSSNSMASRSMHNLSPRGSATSKLPLFGEAFSLNSGPGYGIPSIRPRSGSESSAMHSPNPMFSDDSHIVESRGRNPQVPLDSSTSSGKRQQSHRRIQSDTTGDQTGPEGVTLTVPKPWVSAESRVLDRSANTTSHNAMSRIPVRTRQGSHASDSDSMPSSRANSAMGRYAVRAATPSKGSRRPANGNLNLHNPSQRGMSPLQKSPKRRDQDKDGPHLTANIIAPPPKVSPPLRSSRPRQPVWMATTAASRAKVVEDGQSSQVALSHSSRPAPRKYPELKNVDFAARRSQIISRSAEERARQLALAEKRRQEAEQESQRQAELRKQQELRDLAQHHIEDPETSCTDDTTSCDDDEDGLDQFTTPNEDTEGAEYTLTLDTQNVTPASAGHESDLAGIDSPTLGESVHHTRFSVPQSGVFDGHDTAPRSALTVEAEGTPIDTEPQDDFSAPRRHDPSVLSQVMQMRLPSMLPSPHHGSTKSNRSDVESQSDKESVQIVLRNTAVFEESAEPSESGKLKAVSSAHPSFTPSHGSWTSSIEDDFGPNSSADEQYRQSRQLRGLAQLSSALATHSAPSEAQAEVSTGELSGVPSLLHDSEQDVNEGVRGERLDSFYGPVSASTTKASSQSPSDTHSHFVPSSQSFDLPENRANLAQRKDWEQASPSHAQWSTFAAESTDISDEESKPLPPPKDSELSDRASTPRASRNSVLPTIDSVAQDHSVPTKVSSSDKLSASPPRPPIPAYSPPPPPVMGVQQSKEWLKSQLSSLSHATNTELADGEGDSDSQPRTRVVSSSTFASGQESFYSTSQSVRSSFLHKPASDDVEDDTEQLTGDMNNKLLNEDRPSSASRTNSSLNGSSQSTLVGPAPNLTPEQKRRTKRQHIISELIETEVSFNRDMTVVVDIYKATASESVKLTKDDERILFTNSEEIVKFSSSFAKDLKAAAGELYQQLKNFRKQGDRTSKVTSTSGVSDETSSQKQAAMISGDSDEVPIADVFTKHLRKMEEVYMSYTKNHEESIRKLQALRENKAAVFWLNECAKESNDLTHAWDLSSLLVKPVQRFLKYPLLVADLLSVTDKESVEYTKLNEALEGLKLMASRINERKKQTEIVMNVVGPRKRKETNVGNSFFKAWGRRAEKIKQSVGLSDYVEDRAYDVVKAAHIENRTLVLLLRSDIEQHVAYVKHAVLVFTGFLSEIEEFGTVGDDLRDFPEYKNKWVSIRQVVKDIQNIALPAYIEKVTQGILQPLEITANSLVALEKGIMTKRDNRIMDFSRYRNLAQKGKIDRKVFSAGEEYVALNREAKLRMGSLLKSSKNLMLLLIQRMIAFEKVWWQAWGEKFRFIADKDPHDLDELVRDWNGEWSISEATVLSLSLCNGSMLADTANMVNFATRTSSFTGDNSPRQQSVSDAGKQSFSVDGSPAPNSGSFVSLPMTETSNKHSPFLTGRLRASSTASGGRSSNTTIGSSNANSKRPLSIDTNRNRRPATSSAEPSPHLPRLSIETPSPSLGPFPVDFTFGGTSRSPGDQARRPDKGQRASGAFNSALPMTESPQAKENQVQFEPSSPKVLFLAASVYEFNIDAARREAGFPYLTYISGEIFDVIGDKGELWLARNQDDPRGLVGWIWNKHFIKLSAN